MRAGRSFNDARLQCLRSAESFEENRDHKIKSCERVRNNSGLEPLERIQASQSANCERMPNYRAVESKKSEAVADLSVMFVFAMKCLEFLALAAMSTLDEWMLGGGIVAHSISWLIKQLEV